MMNTINSWWAYAKGLYTITGRATRRDMWVNLGVALLYMGAMLLCLLPMAIHPILGILGVIPGFMMLMVVIGSMFLVVRRMHDLGHSGWVYYIPTLLGWALEFIDPTYTSVGILGIFIGIGLVVWTMLIKGKEEDNIYGPNPYK